MICDLSTVLNNDGATLSFSDALDVSKETEGLGIAFLSPVVVRGEIVCRNNVLNLSAHVEGEMTTNCARCLKELNLPVAFDFEETLSQDGEDVPDRDSVIVFSGTTIDLSDIVVSNLLLNLSYKYLCNDTCRGICQICGADLNQGDCGCSQDEIDPRWEQLKNFK
ncbi:MAG: DUF177 domain-containing protein [Clostridia bacterium]|nr:DUF177 domain-containing protein [Clostridia bacterium]